jgi:hypothetical protein
MEGTKEYLITRRFRPLAISSTRQLFNRNPIHLYSFPNASIVNINHQRQQAVNVTDICRSFEQFEDAKTEHQIEMIDI